MTTPGKQTSGWGSFLQKAVAGVESRLDNILAEGELHEASKSNKPSPAAPTSTAARSDGAISRSASNSSRLNDRLQERLAKAVAAKNAAQNGDSPATSTAPPSRTGSPATVGDTSRISPDGVLARTEAKATDECPAGLSEVVVNEFVRAASEKDVSVTIAPDITGGPVAQGSQQVLNSLLPKENEEVTRLSTDSVRSSTPRDSTESSRSQLLDVRSSADMPSAELPDIASSILKSPADYDVLLRQLQADFETTELQRQEEVHGYIERIDALQAKLQYLAKESAESARRAINSGPSSSLEKKLAEKEEQIALLMEEGQQLSKKELTHLTTIKKLRAKIQDDGKELAEAMKKQERAEKDVANLSDRWKRAEGSGKRVTEQQKTIAQLQRELNTLKAERDRKDSTISDLKGQLDDAVAQVKQVETKLAYEALHKEEERVAELEDELGNLKIEKNLVSDRAQAQITELREKMDMEAERARIAGLEMKTEQQMLESKLEVMRARAEEVSSGATGDAQAKLLRQIETLQTQYAVASENWQGIEASLIARATNLEKERDEASRREVDVRRKAREVSLKAKRNEDELEEKRSQLPSFQQELAEHKAQLDHLHRRAEDAESALIEARSAFEREKQTWRVEMQQRIDEERHKCQEETAGLNSLGHSRAESPVTSTRKGLTSEYLGLQNLQIRRASARSVNSDVPTAEKLLGRRPSAQPLGRISGNGTPTRQDSTQSLTADGEMPDTPSIHTIDHDDIFDERAFPNSPQQTLNDMVSVSTAGAGPSVQLIERMSSAVRRLESEKVATKEDLARLSAQRDEARAEIVALMKDVEAKRSVDQRVTQLEGELKDVNGRYQTTLEMLGEKSEKVEELQSDVDDLKAAYRELVLRTIKQENP